MIIQIASSSHCTPSGILICVSNKKAFRGLVGRQTGEMGHYVEPSQLVLQPLQIRTNGIRYGALQVGISGLFWRGPLSV